MLKYLVIFLVLPFSINALELQDNGYDWNRASQEEKVEVCEDYLKKTDQKVTVDKLLHYYYCIDDFYTDYLNMKIVEVAVSCDYYK